MATLSELQAELVVFKAARTKILEGAQSYRHGSNQSVRADLAEINRQIKELEHRIAIQSNGGYINTGYAVFGGRRG